MPQLLQIPELLRLELQVLGPDLVRKEHDGQNTEEFGDVVLVFPDDRVALDFVGELVVEKEDGAANEKDVWQEELLDNLHLRLPPKPVQHQLDEKSVVEFVGQVV